jgi:hypothetical protein
MTHPRQSNAAPDAAAMLAVLAFCFVATSGRAAPAPEFELEYVPADAVAVVSVRVGALWTHPVVKAAREKLGKDLPMPLLELQRFTGADAQDVERFTAVTTSTRLLDGESVVVVTTKPYDRKALIAAVAPDAKEEKVGERSFYQGDKGPALVCLDDRTYVVGLPDALKSYLNRPAAPKTGALTGALKEGQTHAVLVAVDVAAFARAFPPPPNLPPDAAALLPLLKTQTGLFTADLDEGLRADARLTFAGEAEAGAGAGAAQGVLDLAGKQLGAALPVLAKDADAGKVVAVLTDVADALKSSRAERTGATVKASAKTALDPAKAASALADGSRMMDKAMRRVRLANAMTELTLGSINYADAHNGNMLPAAAIDKSGKPLLSWRVLILPYIGKEDLYKEFHLDEPWDSDHNKKLLEKMPALFAPSNSEAFKKHETYFQALVGKDTVFDGTPLRFPASIPDGTSQTIMYIEAAKSVPWTKPEDVPFDGGALLPKLGGLTKTGFLVGLCDGSVRFFPMTIKEDNLHAWVTRSSGDLPDDPDK